MPGPLPQSNVIVGLMYVIIGSLKLWDNRKHPIACFLYGSLSGIILSTYLIQHKYVTLNS